MERLLNVETEDGLALDGALVAPDSRANGLAVVWIHGNTGEFHTHPYVLVARALAGRGWPVLLGDTRGHGVVSELWNLREDRPVAGGSAYEALDEAPLDVAAWVEAAEAYGPDGVVVAGHSQGAAKAVLYAAGRAEGRLRGVVLASPDLRGHWWGVVPDAERLVAEGRDDELLTPMPEEPWYRLSAANVLSRARVLGRVYASDEVEPRLAHVAVPLLALFAARDVGGAAELETIRANARAAPRVDASVLSGGDHVYTGVEAETAAVIAEWLAAVP